jgi:hypothetical protein
MRDTLIMAVMAVVAATSVEAQQSTVSRSAWHLAASAGLEAARTRTGDKYDTSFVTAGPTIRISGTRQIGSQFILRPSITASFDISDRDSCLTSLPAQSCAFGSHAFGAVLTAATRFWIVETESGFGWSALYRSEGRETGMVANGPTGNFAITLASSPANRRRFFVQFRETLWAFSDNGRVRNGFSLGLDWRR